ncbi:MAG: hypothetical protein MK066_12800 [Crocinitomicaceae bacterium]|nr:hypothetical protein [Crocinitomicaceae bacterium]
MFSEYLYLGTWLLGGLLLKDKKEYRFLLTFLLLQGGLRVFAIGLSYLGNNLFIYQLIGLVELIGAFFIYRNRVSDKWKNIIFLTTIFYLVSSVFIVSIWSLNSIGLAMVQLAIIGLGINYLWNLYRSKSLKLLNKVPFFWINTAFILYASGSFFFHLMSAKVNMETNDSLFNNAWILEAGFGILRLLIICYTFIFIIREK